LFGRLRQRYEKALEPLGEALARLNIPPNLVTLIGLALAAFCCYVLYKGFLLYGLVLMITVGLIDMLDGALARASGKTTKFGGILDRVVDRYVEYAVLLGLIAGGFVNWFWGLFALFGMIMASYTRAAAEAAMGEGCCSVGLMERQEKFLIIMVGALLNFVILEALNYAVILVGLLSHLTVIQRLKHAQRITNA